MRTPSRPEQESDRAAAELVRLVGQTRRRLWIAAARALAGRGESVVAWSLVNRLAELGPLTQRELADASAQHPAGVSRQLGELERKGLTSRGSDPADRDDVAHSYREATRRKPAGQFRALDVTCDGPRREATRRECPRRNPDVLLRTS